MKLFMTPGSCTTGIHILMEELDLAFQAHVLNLPAGDHRQPDYLAINPKGTIPCLQKDDGTALTEFPAIAFWLARRYPRRGLLPTDADTEARALEVMDYVVGTLHMQAFARIFTPEKFSLSAGDLEIVQARGRQLVDDGFATLAATLGDGTYVLDGFSIADAALFYVEFWADKIAIPLPPRLETHYRTMLERPVVRRVLAEEGYRV